MATLTKPQYSIEDKLNSLIKLQKVSILLNEIYTLRGDLPLVVNKLENILEDFKNKQTLMEEEMNGMQQFIEKQKEIIRIAESDLQKYEQQSKNVKNNREYESINKEIETQSLKARQSERNIKDTQNEIKEKIIQWEELKKTISECISEKEIKESELQIIIKETEEKEKKYLQLQEKISEEIDSTLLRTYKRIHKSYKNGLAIVSVLREACGGCFSSVPPQKQSIIRQRKQIVTCENCGRILVDESLYQQVKIK